MIDTALKPMHEFTDIVASHFEELKADLPGFAVERLNKILLLKQTCSTLGYSSVGISHTSHALLFILSMCAHTATQAT